MAYEVITGPAGEPITLGDLKEYMRVNHDDQDDMINSLLVSVRSRVEDHLGKKLISQTVKEYLDCIPTCFELSLTPVSSVTSIKYYDTSGVLTTLSTDVYEVDKISNPVRIALKPGQIWPSVQSGKINAVVIEYVTGYADADAVPERIKTAIKEIALDIYENPKDSHERLFFYYMRSRKDLDDFRTRFF